MKARSLSFLELNKVLRDNKCCFACLRKGHTIQQCKVLLCCFICGKRHKELLCPHRIEKDNDSKEIPVSDFNNKSETMLTNSNRQTLFVLLVGEQKLLRVRCLLDSASQRSYVKKECVKYLGLRPAGEENIRHGLFGGAKTDVVRHNVYNIIIRNMDGSFESRINILDEEKICDFIPRLKDEEIIEKLKIYNVKLTDVDYEDTEIGILLGADVLPLIMTTNMKNISKDTVAMETKLGWTLIGVTQNEQTCALVSLLAIEDLEITELWRLDTIGITDKIEVQNKQSREEDAIEFFNASVTFNDRYEVRLPLMRTSKQLINLKKFEDYDNIFKEWLQLGIIEELGDPDSLRDEKEAVVHYLPHRGVVKESSEFTKLRPVFDASAKDENGSSLNDCLLKGVNLVELIPNIILRFRIHNIGISADIEKAFLQISVAPEDRDALRFIWWKDYESQKLTVFRHKRVVFGVTSSPFLLGAVLNYHLSNVKSTEKITANQLKNSFYIDNCITSLSDERELVRFMKDSKLLLSEGGFNLREWIYNGMENKSSNCIANILGIKWNYINDELFCVGNFESEIVEPFTKRKLLSGAQRIFDPIGFTCPVSIIPKRLLQETWELKLNWDQELPEHIKKKFRIWLNQLHELGECRIPRQLSKLTLEQSQISLHVFTDASKTAYAACIFIRTQVCDEVEVELVVAKSRIAPSKGATIPRLELMAALVGVRLYSAIKEELKILPSHSTYFWSDSTVALTWIKKNEPWSIFVNNRRKEILDKSNPENWYHVPGHLNPADLPSRGCNPRSLVESQWWRGPEWLRCDEVKWPKSSWQASEEDVNKERRKIAVTATNQCAKSFSEELVYFSKYSKIVRMIGWLLRFGNNAKEKNKELRSIGEMTGEEYMAAEKRLIYCVQKETFGSDKKDLKNMNIFQDEDGLLRVKTKLIYANDTPCFKCPIILPSNSVITERLIYYRHIQGKHVGVQGLLSILREDYWILKGRKTVKRMISSCMVCKRHTVKPVEPPFAPLPADRIKEASVFEITGMDFAGPLFLRSGRKVWILLFTCAVYRAIHLEIVHSLSTDEFLLAFRRFLARRGRLSTVYTDNGTNFVGAANTLSELKWDKIIYETSTKRIRWKFNPPTAAWWGGWWERLIGVLKGLLKRELGTARLDADELYTLLCECEAIINDRPLTYFCEDDYLIPLSPSFFLRSIVTYDVADLDEVDAQNLRKRCRYLQSVRKGLRDRFRKEYLSMLVHRGRRSSVNLEVGDIALLEVDNVKRIFWPLAKVTEIRRGQDGCCRVVKVETSNGEFVRPVQRIYPLEMSGDTAKKLSVPRVKQTPGSEMVPKDQFKDTTLHESKTTRSRRQIKIPQRLNL